MSRLFSKLTIREVVLRNRIAVSPMCQYSAKDGVPSNWHLVHLGSRAVGGAGLIIVEATSVSSIGRISPGDLGLWNNKQSEAFKPIVSFIKEMGSTPGIQLAHAGRKASTKIPWEGTGLLLPDEGGWEVIAPSPIPFSDSYPSPKEMTEDDLTDVVEQFKKSAQFAIEAGFQVIEIHAAHGYLLHEFLSPLSNTRQDNYGGSLDNRMRFPLEVIKNIRDVIPEGVALFVRISVTDWANGGWDLNDSIVFSKKMKELGVDLIDCSSGGNIHNAKIPVGPGYQVPFAERIKKEVNIMTSAVGLISTALQAEEILQSEKADIILFAREMLRHPYFALAAAKELGDEIKYPNQYLRGKL